uniref:Uncharacterized protein n=1 Tax=Cacopsylla melanoneura TaxID=428564 RepID=A0A8D8X2X9_9HEMI
MHTVFRRPGLAARHTLLACFEHSNLFKVNVPVRLDTGASKLGQHRDRTHLAKSQGPTADHTDEPGTRERAPDTTRPNRHRQDISLTRQLTPPSSGEPTPRDTHPTTSFLTTTTLIYAIGAGITAAAGTRLALQWILVKRFKVRCHGSK